jgi:hypothetical protein
MRSTLHLRVFLRADPLRYFDSMHRVLPHVAGSIRVRFELRRLHDRLRSLATPAANPRSFRPRLQILKVFKCAHFRSLFTVFHCRIYKSGECQNLRLRKTSAQFSQYVQWGSSRRLVEPFTRPHALVVRPKRGAMIVFRSVQNRARRMRRAGFAMDWQTTGFPRDAASQKRGKFCPQPPGTGFTAVRKTNAIPAPSPSAGVPSASKLSLSERDPHGPR